MAFHSTLSFKDKKLCKSEFIFLNFTTLKMNLNYANLCQSWSVEVPKHEVSSRSFPLSSVLRRPKAELCKDIHRRTSRLPTHAHHSSQIPKQLWKSFQIQTEIRRKFRHPFRRVWIKFRLNSKLKRFLRTYSKRSLTELLRNTFFTENLTSMWKLWFSVLSTRNFIEKDPLGFPPALPFRTMTLPSRNGAGTSLENDKFIKDRVW